MPKRRPDWSRIRKAGSKVEHVWQSDAPLPRPRVPIGSPTRDLERLRNEFVALDMEARHKRAAEFRERMNALHSTPGDHTTYWNLRFGPLLRAQGVPAPPIAAMPATIDSRDVDAQPIPTQSGLSIVRGGELNVRITSTPKGAHDVLATVFVYSLVCADVIQADLWLAWARNEERWVDVQSVRTPFPLLNRLDGRFRMSISDGGGATSVCSLLMARPKLDGKVSLVPASLRELTVRLPVSVPAELRQAGALDVGSRLAVLGDSGRTRETLVATFPDDNEHVPLLAYALTRILPLLPPRTS